MHQTGDTSHVKHNPSYCTYGTYHKVFKQENIGFGEPKEYICDTCAAYKHPKEDEITDSVKMAQENHIEKAQEARHAYKEDSLKAWSSVSRVYAVDVQIVLLLPMINGFFLKSCIFTPRLIVFN